MPCSSSRAHTPITSVKQRGFFGAELARKRVGKGTKTSMSEAELVRHLHESKGKGLPESAHSDNREAMLKALAHKRS